MEKIKWIKLGVNILDDEKIIAIEGMPEGNTLCWMWVKLLALAGKQNRNGEITLTDEVPYTEPQLADRFRMPLTTVQLGLAVFQNYGMISIIDDVIQTTNWAKYQDEKDLDDIREKDRERKRIAREKEKALTAASALLSLPSPPPADVVALLPLVTNGEFHAVTKEDVRKYRELYPGIDVDQEIRSMIGWLDANPKNRKTRTGIKRFINSWLSRAQNKAPRQSYAPPAVVPAPPVSRGLEDWDGWNQ